MTTGASLVGAAPVLAASAQEGPPEAGGRGDGRPTTAVSPSTRNGPARAKR